MIQSNPFPLKGSWPLSGSWQLCLIVSGIAAVLIRMASPMTALNGVSDTGRLLEL